MKVGNGSSIRPSINVSSKSDNPATGHCRKAPSARSNRAPRAAAVRPVTLGTAAGRASEVPDLR